MIIKAAKKIFNSDKICRSYSDLNFGITFFGTQCILPYIVYFASYTMYDLHGCMTGSTRLFCFFTFILV